MAKHAGFALALLLTLASCAAPTPEPLEPVAAGISPAAAESAGTALLAASDALLLETLPLDAGLAQVEEGELDLFLTYAPPPGGWTAVPLLQEGLAVVAHSDNTVLNLTLEEINGLVEGRIQNWSELDGPDEPVQPILPYPGDDLRQVLERRLGWGGVDALALLVPTPGAALSLLADTPGGFALVPLSMVEDEVRLLRVEGVLPGPGTIESGAYPLVADLLALSPQEPQGAARAWLVTWQAAQMPDEPDAQMDATDAVPTATQPAATATGAPATEDGAGGTSTPPPTATEPPGTTAE